MQRALKYFAIFCGVIAALVAVAYWHFYVMTVTVINNSGKQLSEVEIKFAQNVIWRGDIAPGDSKWTFGVPDQEGSAQISYRIDDKKITCIHNYYITPGITSSDQLTVNENGLTDVVVKMSGDSTAGPANCGGG